MGLSAAEKQRRYRERRDADPLKRAAYLQREREKYSHDKAVGKKKNVKDMTPREQRSVKKKWRLYKRQKKMQQLEDKLERLSATPPAEINEENENKSRQKAKGQRLVKRNRQKMKREIDKLKEKLCEEKKRTLMYRKRLERLSSEPNKLCSPRTKAKRLLKCFTPKSTKVDVDKVNRKKVHKTLSFHYALMNELKQGRRGTKKALATVIAGTILRKYKFRTQIQRELGIYCGRVIKTKRKCASRREVERVRKFYERTDVSRITTGVRSTITRRKQKHQKRLLTDTLRNLYKQYKLEENSRISFTTFYRLKPFWVISPSETDRDTCLCKLCENVRLTSKSLFKLKLLNSCDKEELINIFVCDNTKKDCMYRDCKRCKDWRLVIPTDMNDTIDWKYWVTEQKKILQNGSEKVINTVVKQNRSSTVYDVLDIFNQDMQRFARHCYNIRTQNQHYRRLKENLTEKEALISIDFSENYIGKMNKEIQSMHFGASKPQITLHTGIFNTVNMSTSFTTVSDSLEHGPAGVWGHLKPILQTIKSESPEVKTVHIFSDGPVTQYKQKGNFFLFSTELEKLGLTGTWNFHESGHGRGIPDGIGASIKRTANRVVLNGIDIMSASNFVNGVQPRTKVKLFEVTQNEIDVFTKILKSQQLKPVQGTLKLHQVRAVGEGEIKVRDVSCICKGKDCCEMSNPEKSVYFPITEVNNNTSQSTLNRANAVAKTPKLVNPESECTSEQCKKYLKEFQSSKTYKSLKERVSKVKLGPIKGRERFMVEDQMKFDDVSFDDLPEDFEIYPVIVKSDGDCLPSCGSVFAFGHPRSSDEIRVRIIQELCVHDELYLSDEYLSKGVAQDSMPALSKNFAMYSDYYMPGVSLTHEVIRDIFQKEVISLCTPRSFMGMWQIFALSSVLGAPIFSVYPELGNPFVREHLHRMVYPENKSIHPVLHIMWTSTRTDMIRHNWVPNHFVPLLAIAAPNNQEKTNFSVAEQKTEECKYDYEKQKLVNIIDKNPETVQKTEECEYDNEKPMDVNFTEDLWSLLNKYVAVRYDGKPYPGQVIDISESEVYVRCLHQVGKKNEFYWPKLIRDECWYEPQSIISVLPEPREHSSASDYPHFVVDGWENIK